MEKEEWGKGMEGGREQGDKERGCEKGAKIRNEKGQRGRDSEGV